MAQTIDTPYRAEFQFTDELRRLVQSLVPNLSMEFDPDDRQTLVLRGSPEDVEVGLTLLEQLDRSPDEICYDFRLVSLDPAAFKALHVSWNADSKVGIAHGPCIGGAYSLLPFLSQTGQASVLLSPRLTGTSGVECVQDIPELGISVRILGLVECKGKLQLTLRFENYSYEMTLDDGAVVVLRGIANPTDSRQEVVLMIRPLMMY